jgi:phage terminase large subunit
VIADPEDAEGRAQLARYLGCAITPAHKEVRQGIQAVAARMRMAGDGKPRLMLLRDSVIERDPLLQERRAPTCTAEEVESYVWRRGTDGQPSDEPLKEHDDGMDACRYLCAALDLHPTRVEYGPVLYG